MSSSSLIQRLLASESSSQTSFVFSYIFYFFPDELNEERGRRYSEEPNVTSILKSFENLFIEAA
jgi:hypothetical protein